MDRLLLLTQPKGGIPGVPAGCYLQALVPIYGAKDAGRGFYKALREELEKAGFEVSRLDATLYILRKEGKLCGILGSHVDDLIWSGDEEMDRAMEIIKSRFGFGKVGKDNFRFCGLA